MNNRTILFRLKRFLYSAIKNPVLIFKVFDIKKLRRALYALSNVQVYFKDLTKDYQIATLFKTLKKLNLILDKNYTNNEYLIKETQVEELEKKYQNDVNCEKLKNLFNQYGSDKTRTSLVYVYFEIFNNFKINSIFEIGLGTNNINFRSNMGLNGKPGASLRAFRDYLDTKIYGADVDKSILFEEEQIQTFFIDQLNIDTIQNIKSKIPKVDLIIDDGLHQPDANLNVIINLLEHLNSNGFLVIEDIEDSFVDIFQIIEKIFNRNNKFKSSIVKVKERYCLLIQNVE